MARSKKTPASKPFQATGKHPVSRPRPDDDCIVWSFVIFDNYGQWAGSDENNSSFCKVAEYLKAREGMRWSQILANEDRDHLVDVERLSKEARDRLEEIGQVDIDQLFSLRCSGERRIWGIKAGNVFRVLWWDPHHRVCPSKKK